MKNFTRVIFLLTITGFNSVNLFGQIDLKIKTQHGKTQGFETYNIQYVEADYFESPIIKIGGNGNGLTLYIKISRLQKYDSVMVYSFNKFKNWISTSNENQLGDLEKVITTFKTDGSMISDYGYKSGGPCDVEFIFKRKKNYKGEFVHTFEVKSYNSSSVYSAFYSHNIREDNYDYKLKRKLSFDEQLEIYRQNFDLDNILKQVDEHKNSISTLN